ncbi:GNAT family N-acetyltransferase [Leucobacter sp. HY1910]
MTQQLLAPHPADRVDAIIETITLAFAGDPMWGPMLAGPLAGDLSVARQYWKLFVTSAQRYPHTYVAAPPAPTPPGTSPVAATTVWLPPGGAELSETEDANFSDFAAQLLGMAKRDELFLASERFEAAHPTEPHYYLSLLATHPDHRGHNLGMGLLAANLAHFDSLEAPTYLESSNPANDLRYMTLGYERHGSIELPSGLTLSTFWREPHTPATPAT